MQEAIPYKTWTTISTNHKDKIARRDHSNAIKVDEDLKKLVSENAVIVFGSRGCCMIHVVKRLLQGQGVNPAVYEIDEKEESRVIGQLEKMGARKDERLQFPVVFIGGRFFGGLDRVMATHITGELIPVLKQARALWL